MSSDYDIKRIDKWDGEFTCKFKVTFIGEKGVGKSTLIQRIKNRTFSLNYVPTLGGDYTCLYYKLTNGKKNHIIKLSLWDTNGEEKYASITRGYFVGSDAVMVLYDTSSRESWNRLPFWLELINADEDISTIVYLIGTKRDLYENREIPPEAIEEFTKTNTYKIDAVDFFLGPFRRTHLRTNLGRYW